MLQVPGDSALMYRPAVINRGMMKKYGLRTTVLRIVMEAQNYALIELEMHASSQRPMQAVWVGLEEYSQFRKRNADDEDPFVKWLKQQQAATVSKLRAPWERRGWYKAAEQWLTNKLIELGIQTKGSVQQFKAGWPTASILRVSTVQGQIHFKAAYAKPPGEARLTRLLAQKWPDHVPEPLAVDEARNWMVMRDFKIKKENQPSPDSYPEFARTLGAIQVEAMADLAQWHNLKCAVMDLDYLREENGRADALYAEVVPLLSGGLQPLNDEDISRLREAITAARALCDRLAEYKIPDSLSHLDYRPDNFFIEDGKCNIIDWADVAITHPFMAMCRTLDFLDRHASEDSAPQAIGPVDQAMKDSMRDAYLSEFTKILPGTALHEAFDCALKVYPHFFFFYLASQCRIIEAGTPQSEILQSLLKARAIDLIRNL